MTATLPLPAEALHACTVRLAGTVLVGPVKRTYKRSSKVDLLLCCPAEVLAYLCWPLACRLSEPTGCARPCRPHAQASRVTCLTCCYPALQKCWHSCSGRLRTRSTALGPVNHIHKLSITLAEVPWQAHHVNGVLATLTPVCCCYSPSIRRSVGTLALAACLRALLYLGQSATPTSLG